MNIIPASRSESYQGFKIVAKFNIATQQWDWTAEKPVTTAYRLTGVAKTVGDAMGSAKRKINNGDWPT